MTSQTKNIARRLFSVGALIAFSMCATHASAAPAKSGTHIWTVVNYTDYTQLCTPPETTDCQTLAMLYHLDSSIKIGRAHV